MARIRTIKPEFFRHEALYEAERETVLPLRIAFAGLWTAADREGRFRWAPRALKLDCLPYDEVDFSRVLDALMTRGFIVKYVSGDTEYGYIPTWKQHQAINNKERPSDLPEPNENNTLTRDARVDDAMVTPLSKFQGEGKGREGKGKEDADAPRSAFQIENEPELSDEADYFRRFKKICGPTSGGLAKKLLAAKGNVALALSVVLQASTKGDAREYVGAIIRGREENSGMRPGYGDEWG